MKDIAIYGFGGLGREVATIINDINKQTLTWHLIGFFDDGYEIGAENKYGKVLGGIKEINAVDNNLNVIIAIASSEILEKIKTSIVNPNISFPNIIATNVLFFDFESVEMGIGNLLTNGCRLSCDVKLGSFNLLNGCISLGHDVIIGDYNILLPETRMSGKAQIGNSNFFGARSFVFQGIIIGKKVRVAAGSFVMRNTKDDTLYMGNPAKRIEL
jgi:sugar O-acyltransferase (sialic acid O-acetyltransferase NeuD family)